MKVGDFLIMWLMTKSFTHKNIVKFEVHIIQQGQHGHQEVNLEDHMI